MSTWQTKFSRNAVPESEKNSCKKGWHLRAMEAHDLTRVMEIERASFISPWSEQMFLQELGNSFSRCMVAQTCPEGSGDLLGYLCAWFVASEVHVMNLAVHPMARGQGVARDLVRETVEEARALGASRVILEVRQSNRAAQLLYFSEGFKTVGRRLRYYTDTGEDALVMELQLGSRDET